MTSVEDSAIPEVSGNVRANLILSGWKVTKTAEGISIVYITHIDLAGSIPGYILRGVQQQVPLCAGKVVDYLKDYGCPPLLVGGTAQFKEESFDHAKRHYVCELVGEGDGKWEINKKMYPNGFGVQLVQEGTSADINGQELVIKGIQGYVKVNIVKA
ncbi:hypothetical protein G6F56_009634 [Rhizopus delemar]|nr:hypothetical protein G6F56_009634 [Rhizopus delemar]